MRSPRFAVPLDWNGGPSKSGLKPVAPDKLVRRWSLSWQIFTHDHATGLDDRLAERGVFRGIWSQYAVTEHRYGWETYAQAPFVNHAVYPIGQTADDWCLRLSGARHGIFCKEFAVLRGIARADNRYGWRLQ